VVAAAAAAAAATAAAGASGFLLVCAFLSAGLAAFATF